MWLTDVILSLFGSLLAALIVAETKAWAPWLSSRMRAHASKKMPPKYRERFAEEWAAHLEDRPGYISKVFISADFIVAAHAVSFRESYKAWLTLSKLIWKHPVLVVFFAALWKNWRIYAPVLRKRGVDFPPSFFELSFKEALALKSDDVKIANFDMKNIVSVMVVGTHLDETLPVHLQSPAALCIASGIGKIGDLVSLFEADHLPWGKRHIYAAKMLIKLVKAPASRVFRPFS